MNVDTSPDSHIRPRSDPFSGSEPDDRVSAYFMGGGPKVPVGSVYVGCQADMKEERALGEGFMWCDKAMTVPVSCWVWCLP